MKYHSMMSPYSTQCFFPIRAEALNNSVLGNLRKMSLLYVVYHYSFGSTINVCTSSTQREQKPFSATSYASPKPEEWMNWTWWCKIQHHINSVRLFEFVCVSFFCESVCFYLVVSLDLCVWVSLFLYVRLSLSDCSIVACGFHHMKTFNELHEPW